MASNASIQFQVEQLDRRLSKLYLTQDQILNLINIEVGDITNTRADITWLKQQYNIVVGTSHKVLTEDEYTQLMSQYGQVAAMIGDNKDELQRVRGENVTWLEEMQNTYVRYASEVQSLKDRVKRLESNLGDMVAQLGAINAKLSQLIHT